MRKSLFIVLILISQVAYSQVEKGDISITFNGSFTSANSSNFGSLNAKVGRYFTNNIEAGIRPNVQIGEGFFAYGSGAYGTYNFLTDNGKILPYVGLDFSFRQTETDLTGFNAFDAGGYGGVKYFISETINIDAGAIVSSQVFSDATEDADTGGVTFMFNIGIGFIFGKLK